MVKVLAFSLYLYIKYSEKRQVSVLFLSFVEIGTAIFSPYLGLDKEIQLPTSKILKKRTFFDKSEFWKIFCVHCVISLEIRKLNFFCVQYYHKITHRKIFLFGFNWTFKFMFFLCSLGIKVLALDR